MAAEDIWKDIEGFDGKYQASYAGQFRRLYKNGKSRVLQTYTKASTKKRLVISLWKDGKKKEYLAHRVVAETFLVAGKPGQVVYHKNQIVTDNWASNLEYIYREELGKKTGQKSRSKSVVKIDARGEIADFYPSARKAAVANFMSAQTIADRCNGIVKSAFASDGYAYAWEDELKSVNGAMRRIKKEMELS